MTSNNTIIITEEHYKNIYKYKAEYIDESEDNSELNYFVHILGGGNTPEEAKENLIMKAKEITEDINIEIYKS
jgi:hypothetical protein